MAGNPNYSKVSLQLNCDGAVDSTAFADVGPVGRSITTYTGAKVVENGILGRALSLNGSGYLTAAASSDFNFGSGDFTVECWAYFQASHPTTGGFRGILSCDNVGVSRGWLLLLDGDVATKLRLAMFSGATSYTVSASETPALNTWTHIAATRSGANLRLFINGGLASTTDVGTAAINNNSGTTAYVGALNFYSGLEASSRLTGLLSGIRITKGVAVYTSEFTPSAGPLGGQQYLINGVIKDGTDTPAAREVVAVVESTDRVVHTALSDGTTGAYQIESDAPGAHTLIAYPAGGEPLPALVLRGVVPVAVP